MENLTALADAFGPIVYAIYAFYLITMLVQVVSMWVIYEKAGQPGWASLVPFYNAIILMRIIGRSDWYWLRVLTIILCGLGLIWVVIILNDLVKSFGKGVGFTIGLLFFPVIFYAILAFSKDAKYVGPAAAKPTV